MIPNEIKLLIADNWKTLLIIGSAVAIGIGSISFLEKDNIIEEKMEQIIKDQTGLDIDLSH
jgi:hypothetical protein